MTEKETALTVAHQLTTSSFNPIKERFLQLKSEENFIKEISFAMQIVQGNSMLKRADADSVLECVINLAQTDLSLNPVLKLAYLIPFNHKTGEKKGGNDVWIVKCRVEPSYQGLVKLVTDTGSAQSVYSHVVFEGDTFETSLGTSVEITHKPKYKSKTVTHVYAVGVLAQGFKQVQVMTLEEIEKIRDEMSESHKAFKDEKKTFVNHSIWDDHFEEMAKKTVIKRLVKYLPKTNMWDKLGQAIKLDNMDYKATDAQINMIDGLIFGAQITPEQLEELNYEVSCGLTRDRASELINELTAAQGDPIEKGENYNPGDATDKVAEKLDDPKA